MSSNIFLITNDREKCEVLLFRCEINYNKFTVCQVIFFIFKQFCCFSPYYRLTGDASRTMRLNSVKRNITIYLTYVDTCHIISYIINNIIRYRKYYGNQV